MQHIIQVLFSLPSSDGTSGQVLQTNGSGVLSFAGVGASAGQVIQVITATDSTQRTTSGSSFTASSTTLVVTITPLNTSSRFFICVTASGYTDAGARYTVFRNATDLGNSTHGLSQIEGNVYNMVTMSIVDSPNTASAITYEVRFRNTVGSDTRLNIGTTKGSITVMEIKG